MKLAWLTDLHLNFINTKERISFYQTIVDAKIDAILLTGDPAEASSICDILWEMAQTIAKPIYFVLGNHDYYKGSVAQVRSDITNICKWQCKTTPHNSGANPKNDGLKLHHLLNV